MVIYFMRTTLNIILIIICVSLIYSNDYKTEVDVFIDSDTAIANINSIEYNRERKDDILNNELTIVYPNGGERLVVGDTIEIKWSGIDSLRKVRIEYSTDEGENWILIIPGAIGFSYKWVVSKTPTDICLFRIISLNKLIADEEFVLVPAGLY